MQMNHVVAPPKVARIGALLLDAGKITAAEADCILRLQTEQGVLFGDAARTLGLVTEEDIRQALSQQFDFPILENTDSGLSTELIAAYQPFSSPAETLRSIRSQLLLRWFASGRKALSIVSADKQEGRSYLAANLAITFSHLGKRTLLIDADLRSPRQNRLFNIDQKQGLSDILAARAETSVITSVPVFNNLSILTAGTLPPNPMELISRSFGPFLEQFATDYDVILVDTPAGSYGSDAHFLAVKTGGMLLLARRHKTHLAELERIKNLLESSGVACVGAVINDF